MLSDRLIKMVESHADELTRRTVMSLRSSPSTPSYSQLSDDDIFERVYSVYHNFGRWLGAKSDDPLQSWYHHLGEKRFQQGIPLSEVIWALTLTKRDSWDYIRLHGLADTALELHAQQELHMLLDYFFDRSVFFTAQGYEQAASGRTHRAAAAK